VSAAASVASADTGTAPAGSPPDEVWSRAALPRAPVVSAAVNDAT